MLFQSINWEKKGLVITPDKLVAWRLTHAMMPTPYQLDGSLYRIYFSGRNEKNQSNVGYALIDLVRPNHILEYSKSAVLKPGRLGTFDDNGVLASCVIQCEHELFMYTIGFKPGGTTRMDLFGGLAVSTNTGKSFKRWSEAPILERNRINPYINTAPWVLKEESGYRMYYVSGTEWVSPDLPRYNIQTAISDNGKDWFRDGTVVIDFLPGENALARPYVIKENGIYRMWFSSKGEYYLPQYAESTDGVNWTRYKNAIDLKPTPNGPDSEMICYPIVLKHKGKHIMYYNGNAYGKFGICLALEK